MTTEHKRPSWNKIGWVTLGGLCLGALTGIWLMRLRIFLAPPLAASTPYFYMAVAILPALVTFIAGVRARPAGKRLMLAALPLFSLVLLVIYLTLLGPGFYTDIRCQATAGAAFTRQLDCECVFASSEGKALTHCTADKFLPLPLIRLVEEK